MLTFATIRIRPVGSGVFHEHAEEQPNDLIGNCLQKFPNVPKRLEKSSKTNQISSLKENPLTHRQQSRREVQRILSNEANRLIIVNDNSLVDWPLGVE